MRSLFFILLFVLSLLLKCFSQGGAKSITHIETLLGKGRLLDKGWKFHLGDDPTWATTDVSDSSWTVIDINESAPQFLARTKGGISWLRLHFTIDSTFQKTPLALAINQYGASAVFIDDQLIQRFGKIASNEIVLYNPHNNPVPLLLGPQSSHVMAIRFACPMPSPAWVLQKATVAPLTVKLQPTVASISQLQAAWKSSRIEYGIMFINVVFGFLFLFIFFFYRRQPLNLYFGLQNFSVALLSYFSLLLQEGQYGLSGYVFLQIGLDFFGRVAGATIMMFILHALYPRVHPFFKWFLIYLLTIAFSLFTFFPRQYAVFDHIHHFLFMLILLWLSIRAFRNANLKDWFIGIMAFVSFFVNIDFFLNLFWGIDLSHYAFLYPAVVFPSMIIYLALKYAQTNTSLERQLIQVEKLSEENLRSEQEKQQILAAQNETLEKQVAERTAALQQSLQDLKATQKQLVQSEKMASLGELTAGIAHEIQNPLNFVTNFSEVNAELIDEMQQELRSGHTQEAVSMSDEIKENNGKVLQHSKRADSIVKSMLQHSRADHGRKESTDINKLADEYLRLSYHGFRARDKSFNAVLHTHFDPNVGMVDVIPQEIGRVLLNLFNNAFYAVHEQLKKLGGSYQPTVIVSTKRLANTIEISLQDNGMGISKSLQEKIFQPFFTTKPTGQGTGLGLSLSYDIVKAHGGALTVTSGENEGATFTILLPCT